MLYDKQKIDEIEQAKEAWEKTSLKPELDRMGEWKRDFSTSSGLPVERNYTPLDLEKAGWDYNEQLGFPGQYPFTRGVSANMYRGELFRRRQYAGYGTGKTANERYKYLLEQGINELSIALDLPTQLGYDSDNPLSKGEIGKIGVAVDSLLDMEELLQDIPLDRVTLATTANAIGPIFLAWMLALAEKRGISPEKLQLNIQNDVLKEFIARGTYIFEVKPSVKFSCDVVEYCVRNGLSNIMPINYCEYHIREAGGDVVQGLAFCLANAIAYIKELVGRGVDINELPAPWINTVAGMDFFEEICKFRVFRRIWARVVKERFGATEPRVMALSYRCGSQGSAYTAQQPLNNIVRGTISALIQVLGGAQAIEAHSYDEALGIPSAEAAKVAIRTEQILAYEAGVINTADPLGGSYFVERLTDEIEERVMKLFNEAESMGGAVVAIERGFMSREISQSAYRQLKERESGERVTIGVNLYREEETLAMKAFRVDPAVEEEQLGRLKKLRSARDDNRVKSALAGLREAAVAGTNLVPPVLEAVRAYATIGEISGVLRGIFGEYREIEY